MKNEHFNALRILSYNAILNFIISNRNYGKTWSFKRRAFRRALKHNKKTLWLRIFENEVKECSNMYGSVDLQKYCGIIPYDPKTKKGNFKQVGNTCYIFKNGQWQWFLKIAKLGDSNAIRGADDVNLDTIVFDEFTTTPNKLRQYHGSIVNDFIDIFYSVKREHQVRCFLLGNKENVLNPFISYFNLPYIPQTYQGIKTFKNGSIAYQQINNKPIVKNEYDVKTEYLLQGTAYGNYIYNDEYKGQKAIKTAKAPANSAYYIQLNIKGVELKLSIDNGNIYVSNKIDKLNRVYTLEITNKYKYEYKLLNRDKRHFTALLNAISLNKVCYQNISLYEAIQPFYRWLNA